MPETDLALLERYSQGGDVQAFTEIVRRYAGMVFATSQRILHDPSRAEDVAQETFYRLMTRPQRVTQSLGGWLHQAATRLAIDTRRSEVARRQREASYEAPTSEPAPDGGASWAEVSPVMDEALSALPAEPRGLLVRHFLRGQSQADLATELRTSPATMSRRVKQAIDLLREELDRRGVNVTPMALAVLCTHHAAGTAPAAVMAELGKMTLLCGARAIGASGGTLPWSGAAAAGFSVRGVIRSLVLARWSVVAALVALIAAAIVVLGVRAMVNSPGRPGPSLTDGNGTTVVQDVGENAQANRTSSPNRHDG